VIGKRTYIEMLNSEEVKPVALSIIELYLAEASVRVAVRQKIQLNEKYDKQISS